MNLDYPLGYHTRTLLRIGPEFVEPINDDVPTDKERQLRDFDIESKDEDHPDIEAEEHGPDDKTNDDDMDEA